ncbi:Integrin alpha-L CD11 antigen-like family member A [Triplophysa tibetana]|uniref:Integrin alpha-L CD11 antigen-like family member A n=1 Tax=Triplophysa tibetana TaxID=1572043 RepID=A0A5A9PLM0_9TELE|nr:Integrin alpha-L CD11 antigen-like family member A [Triplophysa tibetana]
MDRLIVSVLFTYESSSSLDLSAAVSSSAATSITSCSPFLASVCDGNSYLNGICFQYNSTLQPVSNFTTGIQECTKRDVNLVFLFDGSSSMKSEDFELNKKFIISIMTKLSNSSIKFAAVQFSKTFKTVFDFNDYQKGVAEKKLMNEPHMNSLTNTHGAISFTLNLLLNNVSSGANPNATKALVIITDGDPSDNDDYGVIKKCDAQNVLRYIIGVGEVSLTNLYLLASKPNVSNTFRIDHYSGLQGLLDNLQNKIYNIEGSQEAHGRDRQNELSQSGFSVVYHTDMSYIFRLAGVTRELADDWFLCFRTLWLWVRWDLMTGVEFCYSSVIGRRGGVSLLFSGAPRAEHTGQVTLFIQTGNKWIVNRSIAGDQIGSYFGASLGLLDVDSDGESDFLLVGAPLYHRCGPRTEGRLYVYSLSQSFEKMLNVCESNAGRFAASVASLKDINGDGLSDVAVGAPLEDDGTGVVYIYLGDKTYGINTETSPQRISGRSVLPGLQQFGVSVVGQMDMNGDNLTDVLIGAHGGIVLLKARPVMSVSLQLSFSPKEISIRNFDCEGAAGEMFQAFNVTSCFSVSEQTNSIGSLNKNLNIALNINLDVLREMNRGFFRLHNSTSRSQQMSVPLLLKSFCSDFSVFMPKCVYDTVSPLKIRMNFSQTENILALLDIHSRTEEFVEVPFEKNCKSNSSCVADLTLDFSFINETLLVVNQAHLTVQITLKNAADDSYNTSIVMHYPEGLSFSKLDNVKSSRTSIRCGDRDIGAMNRTTCSISLPVYRSGATTVFLGMFRVSKLDYDWPNMIDMIITANSDNNGNTTDATVKRSLAVLYAVDLAISLVGEESVTFVPFSLEDREPKPLTITYKVENVGVKGLPVSVTLNMTCETAHVKIRPLSFGIRNGTQCTTLEGGHCGRFECEEFHLQTSEAVYFNLTAEVALHNMTEFQWKYSFHEFSKDFVFNITAHLDYDKSRYNQTISSLKTTMRVEFVIPPNRWLIGCIGGVGGLILLIFILVLLLKCGFFKRNRPDESEVYGNSTPEDYPLMDVTTKGNDAKKTSDGEMKTSDGEMKGSDGEMKGSDGEMKGSDGEMKGSDGEMRGSDGGESVNDRNGVIENGVKEQSLTSEGPNTGEP